jgi:hypothetical protein
MTWRDHLKIHPACALFPKMSDADLKKLGERIKAIGLKHKVEIRRLKNGTPELIDGQSRLDAMAMVGIELINENGLIDKYFKEIKLADDQVVEYIAAVNIDRRHMKVKDRVKIGLELNKLKPTMTDREVSKAIDVDHKTYGRARKKAEERGELPHVETRKDAKGRRVQAHKPAKLKKAKATPANSYEALKKKLTGNERDPVLIIEEASIEHVETIAADNDVSDWVRKLARERLDHIAAPPPPADIVTLPPPIEPTSPIAETAPISPPVDDHPEPLAEPTLQERVDRLADEILAEAEALPAEDCLFFLDKLRGEIDTIEHMLKKASPSITLTDSEAAE